MKAEYQIKVNKVLLILVSWMILSMVITVYDWLLLHSAMSAGRVASYSFLTTLILNLTAGTLGALLGGSFLVFYINEKLRDQPYWKTVVLTAMAYITIVTFITVLMTFIFIPIATGKPLSHPDNEGLFLRYVSDPVHQKNLLAWAFIVALTQLTLQINDKFGQGILWNFIRGFYQVPKIEERIFMFVDLQSSTSLAEQLGNERYHLLLKEFFADITNSVLYNKGEIYQYVGDEIVISWKMKSGIMNHHCLKCFFDMRKSIQGLSDKYISLFGLVPEFKAGFHYGKVIAGEIGIIKRDITYSGDVLNTASRVQGMCNQYAVKILCTDALLLLLPEDGKFRYRPLGQIELKGKEQAVALSTVELI